MEIVSYTDCSELASLANAWERLSEHELRFVPSFLDLRRQLESDNAKFRFLVAIDHSQITAMACFVYVRTKKRYEIATKNLFRLPVRQLTLYGSSILGQPTEDVIRKFFRLIMEEADFDFINVGEILVDFPLYRAVTSLHRGVTAWRSTRKQRLWWLIRLPGSFDEYLASLPKRTRIHITRDCQKCGREGIDLRVMQRAEDVIQFLQDAETISRSTYQWKLGYGTRNDEATRQHLVQLAAIATLRCYILYLRGAPCAFGWGELSHRAFVFQETGYDPQYGRLSPGTNLIVGMIRDLIENADCRLFDFKWGGEDGYKARFGNASFGCVSMQVAPVYRPYSLLLIMLDHALNLFKNLVGSIVELGAIKPHLRAVMRRFGMGTF